MAKLIEIPNVKVIIPFDKLLEQLEVGDVLNVLTYFWENLYDPENELARNIFTKHPEFLYYALIFPDENFNWDHEKLAKEIFKFVSSKM